MTQRLIPLLLAGTLVLPAVAEARQSGDPKVAARLTAAYQRGAAKPAPPEGMAEEGLCASAWSAVVSIYNDGDYAPPPGLDGGELDWQGQLWYDRIGKHGSAGETAMQTARDTLVGPLYDAAEYEKIMEIAGACGTTG